ncbi:STE3-domain-containing protein [Gyrodon lividus]|nr:STE3-domain-containing protein [Gyrodon lividus]
MSLNVNPTYPLFPVSSFLGFFLVLIPLPWHFEAWNAGTCAYIIWASLGCLLEFVNSVVWRNNALNIAPVWCDISSKVLLGAGIGIPAAGLCISRRLYMIAVIKSTVVTRQDKRRAVIIDLCIAFGLPMIVMTLHYVVQGHRFDILQDVGCYPSIYNTLPAYFLVFMWPTLLGCISFVFSLLTLRAFYKRRLEFSQFITSNNSSLNINRYIRLMMLAVSEMFCTIPISIYSVYIANKGVPLQPWISWANTHYNFSYVGLIPAVEWMGDPSFRTSVELTRWLFPASALLFFLLFGFATEARKNYRAAFLFVAKFFGYRPASKGSISAPQQWKSNLNKNISVGSLPVCITPTPPRIKRVESFASSVSTCTDKDVEKSADCPSPTPPRYSREDHDLSLTPTHSEVKSNVNHDDDVEAGSICLRARSPDYPSVPAYHRPFTPPSVSPVSHHEPRELQLFNSIAINVQTEYASAV